MFIFKGGYKVGKGTYWNLSSGRRIDVNDEAVLSGGSEATFLRLSSGIMLLVGPFLGLLYVLCLPFIGLVTIMSLIVKKLVNGILGMIGKSLSFGWRPKEAYLSGKKKSKKDAR
jgi:VIT1/CCC1 family predicted Fe2+/Mn2+ transporter